MAVCRNRVVWLIVVLSASSLRAQEGGFLAEFCPSHPSYKCTEDALEVVFDSGTSTHAEPVDAGSEIPVRIVMDVKNTGIQGRRAPRLR